METKNVEVSQKKLFFRFFFVGLISLFFLSNFAYGSDWYDENWDFRKLITIDSTKVSGTHTNFPIIVDITDSDLLTGANSDGSDILFTDSDGTTLLNFEIERYDSLNGNLLAWVEVPNVDSSNGGEIYMYYGNSGATSSSNSAGVWDNYEAVYHLDQEEFGSESTVDSKNSFAGTPENMDSSNIVDGKIGKALDFDGSSEKILLGDIDLTGRESTISAWMKYNSGSGAGVVMSKSLFETHGASPYYAWTFFITSSAIEARHGDYVPRVTNSVIDEWAYVTATMDGNNLKLYLNGVEVENITVSEDILSSDRNAVIGGRDTTNTGEFFNGQIDEVRISNTFRSSDYIATSYNNQNSPSTFLSLSDEEEVPDMNEPEILDININEGDIIYTSSTTISFTVTDDILVDTVTLNFDNQDIILTGNGDDTYSYEATGLEDGVYSFTISANDTSGNEATPQTINFEVSIPGWYNEEWSFRKPIIIDSTKVSGTHTNFPIIVDITDSELLAGANSDGSDILFTDSDGETLLDFEIERYDSSNGNLLAWVEVLNVDSSNGGEIYMYYGNSEATSSSDSAGVWENYEAVYHLDQEEFTSGSTVDSKNSFAGTPENMDSSNIVDGKIGKALDFDGSSERILLGDIDLTGRESTISAWIKYNSGSAAGVPLSKSAFESHSNPFYAWAFYIGGAVIQSRHGTYTPEIKSNDVADEWAYLTATMDGTDVILYLDGVEIARTGVSTDYLVSDRNAVIGGRDTTNTGEFFNGQIDEVRISNTYHSADYIATSYNNQNSPSTFLSLLDEEEVVISDTTGPTITNAGTSSKNKVSEGNTEVLIWVTTDEDASCKYSTTENEDFSSKTQMSVTGENVSSTTLSNVFDGSHTYYFNCEDAYGNIGDDYAFPFDTDATSPTISNLLPADATKINTDSITVTFDASDVNLDEVTISFNNGAEQTLTGNSGSYSYTESGLSEGSSSYTIIVTDTFGNNVSETRTVVVDTILPTITDVLPEDKATVESTSQTISFKATDETALSSVTLNFNGADVTSSLTDLGSGSYQYQATNLVDGTTYTYTITAVDGTGNEQSASATFTVAIPDESKPVIENLAPANGANIKTDSTTISFDVTDNDLSTVTLNFDGTDVTTTNSGNTYSYSATGLTDGDYTYTITAVDGTGNEQSASATFSVAIPDESKPVIENLAPANGANIKTDSTTISFDVTDNDLSTVTLNFDGTDVTTTNSGNTYSYSATGLTDGDYTYTITAVDGTGNEQSASATFSVAIPDESKPVIENLAPANGANIKTDSTTISFDVTDNDLSSVTLNFDGTDVTTTNSGNTYSYSATGLTDGDYTYTITAVDGTGNEQSASATFTVAIPDESKPVIENLAPANGANIKTDSTTISFDVTDNDLSTVTLNFDGTDVTTTNSGNTYSYSATGLTDGDYTYTITAVDGTGNEQSASATFTVELPDTTDPTISITSPTDGTKVTTDSQVIQFTASDNIGLSSVSITFDDTEISLPVSGTSYSYTATGLSDGTYTYTVKAVDTSNNEATDSGNFIVELSETTDPRISSATPLNGATISSSSTTISFTVTDSDDDLSSVTLNFGGNNVNLTQSGNTYSYTTETLVDGSYTYIITAIDANNAQATLSNTFTVDTSAEEDDNSGSSSGSSGNNGNKKKEVEVSDSIKEDDSLEITIGEEGDINDEYSGVQAVKIENKELGFDVLEFEHDFSSNLDLENLKISDGKTSDEKNYLIISGLELKDEETKTVRIVSQSDYICVKDAEINSIDEISQDCLGNGEYLLVCNGYTNSVGHSCDKKDGHLEISGLRHSGIIEYSFEVEEKSDSFNYEDTVQENSNNNNNNDLSYEDKLEEQNREVQNNNLENREDNREIVEEKNKEEESKNLEEETLTDKYEEHKTLALVIIAIFVLGGLILTIFNSRKSKILRRIEEKHREEDRNR